MSGRKQGGADGQAGPVAGPGSPADADLVLVTPKVRRARRRTAKAAVPRAMADKGTTDTGTAGTEILAAIDRLRRSMDQVVQGLGAMVETQATHTELLDRLMQAATMPTGSEHALSRILEQLVVQLDRQGRHLQEIGAGLTRLPGEVGTAVAHEVTAALTRVR